MIMINLTRGKQLMAKITAICSECHLAFTGGHVDSTFITARCKCGGLLVKPEIEMPVDVHYKSYMKVISDLGHNDHANGTMH